MLGRLLRPAEQRAITAASIFETGQMLPSTTRAGVTVTQDTAFKIGVVYAAIRLVSDVCSALPLDAYVREGGVRRPLRPKPEWVNDPEPDLSMTRLDHFQAVYVSLLLAGNSFTRIVRDDEGEVVALAVLDPNRVKVDRAGNGRIVFIVDQQRTLTEDEVIHIADVRKPGQLRGVSRIDELKDTLGLTRALELFSAEFFGSGSTATGIIEVPTEIDGDQAKQIQDGWESGHKGWRKAHRPGILSGGATYKKTSVDPDEAQMLGSREFQVEEVARLFRISPHLLGSTKPGAMSYASVAEMGQAFVTYTVLPLVSKVEDAYSRLLPRGAFLKFNVDGLLRASIEDRYAAYSVGQQAGFLSINDIHRLEDMSPVVGGDVYRVPLSHVGLPAAQIVETEKNVQMATDLIAAGADPAATLAAFGLPPIPWRTPEPAPDPTDDTEDDPVDEEDRP